MTRGTEVVRELPPDLLVPREELARARERASRRQERTRGGPADRAPFVRAARAFRLPGRGLRLPADRGDPGEPPAAGIRASHVSRAAHLLAGARPHRGGGCEAPLTYRELVRRLQIQYAGRPQGSPTPLVEGKGQDRIVLGTQEVVRSPLVLTQDRDGYKVNAGDLYGLTPGSILAVDSASATGTDGKPKLLGHVQVLTTRPFDATVEPCAL